MLFKEIEFKYNADNISLTDFTAFCKKQVEPYKFILASGYDHFYDNAESADYFYRHRVGPDMNQLTIKRKTNNKNNFIRGEHNLNLSGTFAEAQVKAYLAEHSYAYNFSLFKNCFVYTYNLCTFVYYVCYDLDLKEIGRFLEIEMAEDGPWKNEQEAWDRLIALEKSLESLGISPKKRMRTSLFEMYRK